jgi:hypothetical protein
VAGALGASCRELPGHRIAVDAARALFNEHLGDPSIPLAVVILGVLAAVALVSASRSFSRSTA